MQPRERSNYAAIDATGGGGGGGGGRGSQQRPRFAMEDWGMARFGNKHIKKSVFLQTSRHSGIHRSAPPRERQRGWPRRQLDRAEAQ